MNQRNNEEKSGVWTIFYIEDEQGKTGCSQTSELIYAQYIDDEETAIQ